MPESRQGTATRKAAAKSTPAPASDAAGDDRYTVEAVERFGRICALFSVDRPTLTAREIAELIAVPQRTVGKILDTLEHHDLVMRDEDDKSYRPGFAWLRLGELGRASVDLREAAMPVMRRLRDRFNETVILSVRIGDLRVNVDFAESTHTLRRVTRRGLETPLHVGAGGRALLAGLTDDEITAYFSRTTMINYGHDTPTDIARIWRDLHAVRRDGYLIATSEISEGSSSVSAPVRDFSGATKAALTIGGPFARFGEAARQRCVPAIVAAAAEILSDHGTIS
jgi:DNA-binding IclR family transcriptional regulator